VAVTSPVGTAAKGTPKAATGVTATVVVTAGEGTAALEGGPLAATGVTATVTVAGGEGTATKEAALAAAGIAASVIVTGGAGTAAKEAAKTADGVTALVTVTAGTGTASALQLDGPITFVVRLTPQGFEADAKQGTGTASTAQGSSTAQWKLPSHTAALRRGTMEAQEA
jgi:hypothetical protein